MSNALLQVASHTRERARKAFALVAASMVHYRPYSANTEYTAQELEPYDALADRYVRAVEIAIKYFRSHERLMFAESSDTYRDLLNRMEKAGLISAAGLWIEMRDLRNRIVHDYLPDQVAQLYALMTVHYVPELFALDTRLAQLDYAKIAPQ